MKLHVFDFDGTIFRSPVPHPSLGESWLEWIQGATVEGLGIGWFQEPDTLNSAAGVAESPEKNSAEDFVLSTIETARKAKQNGDHVIVMTGRSEYFLPRINHLLKCGEFPNDGVFAKRDVFLGTVKYKAYEISKVVRQLNRKQYPVVSPSSSSSAAPAAAAAGGFTVSSTSTSVPQSQQQQQKPFRYDPVTAIVLYDDRLEQMTKIASKLRESWPDLEIQENHVQATDRYVPTAEMENKLLWKIFRESKDRLGPIREIPHFNHSVVAAGGLNSCIVTTTTTIVKSSPIQNPSLPPPPSYDDHSLNQSVGGVSRQGSTTSFTTATTSGILLPQPLSQQQQQQQQGSNSNGVGGGVLGGFTISSSSGTNNNNNNNISPSPSLQQATTTSSNDTIIGSSNLSNLLNSVAAQQLLQQQQQQQLLLGEVQIVETKAIDPKQVLLKSLERHPHLKDVMKRLMAE